MPATVLAACEMPSAAGSRSTPTMPGSSACQLAELIACPVPSAATRASSTGWLGSAASARQQASCPQPEPSSSRRLSSRSTSRPTSGASSTSGRPPASSSATTGQAPSPRPWVRSSSATRASSSPSSETARASTTIRRSRTRHSEPADTERHISKLMLHILPVNDRQRRMPASRPYPGQMAAARPSATALRAAGPPSGGAARPPGHQGAGASGPAGGHRRAVRRPQADRHRVRRDRRPERQRDELPPACPGEVGDRPALGGHHRRPGAALGGGRQGADGGLGRAAGLGGRRGDPGGPAARPAARRHPRLDLRPGRGGASWYDSTVIGSSVLWLTQDEAKQLSESISGGDGQGAAADRRSEAPPGARQVRVSFSVVPVPRRRRSGRPSPTCAVGVAGGRRRLSGRAAPRPANPLSRRP